VEEGGMLSVDLMSMLVNSLINPDCRIVINLDLRQIPPVGCGCPLRDMILSEIINVNKLTKVFRYGEGGLAKMASDSYDQIFYIKDFVNEDKAVVGKNKDYTYIKYKSEQQAIKAILDTYMEYIKEDKAKPEDICVVTPWNVHSLGAITLNNKIQAIVNPNTDPQKSITKKIRGQSVTFKVGDIILNTENNYNIMTQTAYRNLQADETLTKHDVPMGTCMNGELGKIVNIEDGNIIAQFDEDILVFDKKSQDKLMLGYSLTTYKMQGSEIPYGISLITPQFLKTLNSNITYTGLSRGRKKMSEIIDPDVLAKVIVIDGIMDRETNMQKIFRELLKGA
jgi:ATP-dependent exoDNAse (exonuclease V) alpha subunit